MLVLYLRYLRHIFGVLENIFGILMGYIWSLRRLSLDYIRNILEEYWISIGNTLDYIGYILGVLIGFVL